MITLSDMRARVTSRLAEESSVFWTEPDRNRAINDAVRLVSSLTKGVTQRISEPSYRGEVAVEASLVGFRGAWGEWNGYRLPAISTEEAQVLDSRYPTAVGTPRWVVFDISGNRIDLYPHPVGSGIPIPWHVQIPIFPNDIEDNDFSTLLFGGIKSMGKYLNATDLIACAYLLLQERFDGDAERFYQMGIQELVILGVDSAAVPPLQMGLGPQGGNPQ